VATGFFVGGVALWIRAGFAISAGGVLFTSLAAGILFAYTRIRATTLSITTAGVRFEWLPGKSRTYAFSGLRSFAIEESPFGKRRHGWVRPFALRSQPEFYLFLSSHHLVLETDAGEKIRIPTSHPAELRRLLVPYFPLQ
jgi:hypothetical protein